MISHFDNRIFVVNNFLVPNECNNLIAYIDNKQLNYTGHEYLKGRYGEAVYDLSDYFFQKLSTISPYGIPPYGIPSRCTNRTMIFRYGENASGTKIHKDQRIEKDEKFCCIIYLNNVTNPTLRSEFGSLIRNGGETIFYNDVREEILTINPTEGKLVMFNIDVFHKGCDTQNVKYIVCPSLCYN